MQTTENRRCVAFEGHRCIAAGEIQDVARRVKEAIDRGVESMVLIFDAVTSEPVEIDFRGSVEDVLARIRRDQAEDTVRSGASGAAIAGGDAANAASGNDASTETPDGGTVVEEELVIRGPGRPRLGVIAREVTLLPRHWEWLNAQPGGASATLRKMVEIARKENRGDDARRASQNAAYTFMNALAGDLPGYEEATRALFAGDRERFHALTADWPADIRDHARTLADDALETSASENA